MEFIMDGRVVLEKGKHSESREPVRTAESGTNPPGRYRPTSHQAAGKEQVAGVHGARSCNAGAGMFRGEASAGRPRTVRSVSSPSGMISFRLT